jgi:hypothetical protein
MPSEQYMLDAFENAIRQNVTDLRRVDIDGYDIGFAQSKSYWVNLGHPERQWTENGLPQIGIHKIGGYSEGKNTLDARWEGTMMRVDIFASGKTQRTKLAGEVKNGFFNRASRFSLLSSGVKVDKLLSDSDSVEDDMLPQEVNVRQITFGLYYNTSGA